MSNSDFFKQNKYVFIPGFLDKGSATELTEALQYQVSRKNTWKDYQCPKSESLRDSPLFDKLLLELLPHIEEATGKKLFPTYAYARLYVPGEELKIHVDRPACEISATLTLGFKGNVWPIYVGDNADKSNNVMINMEPGDIAIYMGLEKFHWREKYTEGEWQAQVFLHYVDQDGPHAEWKFDKREGLSTVQGPKELHMAAPQYRSGEFVYYNDILTPQACEIIIKTYESDLVEKHPPLIGSGDSAVVNTSIRNVSRVMLPTYKDIGGRLAAAGLAANAGFWKFDIRSANQSEFLKYPAGGRYKQHVDTFIDPDNQMTRKLTVLAFLNDDFEGGKFFLMNGHEKTYPPQTKGTVLVFPSFMLHGVEDVISGFRYSVVTWMVGPFFK